MKFKEFRTTIWKIMIVLPQKTKPMKYLLWSKRWLVGKESYRYTVLQYGPLENFEMCYKNVPLRKQNENNYQSPPHAPTPPPPPAFHHFLLPNFPHLCIVLLFPYLPTCMTVSFHNNLTWGGGGGLTANYIETGLWLALINREVRRGTQLYNYLHVFRLIIHSKNFISDFILEHNGLSRNSHHGELRIVSKNIHPNILDIPAIFDLYQNINFYF